MNCVSAIDDNQTMDGVTTESDSVTVEILTAGEGNYTDLQSELDNAVGEFKFTRDYVYNNGDPSFIEINQDNFVIDGQGHTINGKSEAQIFCTNYTGLTIKNLKLIKGFSLDGSGAVYSQGSTIFKNCTFLNNFGTAGTAVYSQGNIYIENCTFIDNIGIIGGAVLTNATATITSSKFINNSAMIGGAVYATSALLTGNDFINNSVGYNGTVFLKVGGNILNSNFINNTAEDSGSAVFMGMGGNITNCHFINNSVRTNGAVFMGTGGNVLNSYFSMNNAKDSYAAVYIGGIGIIANSYFYKNNAAEFGAVYLVSGYITNCNFTNNTASNAAGAEVETVAVNYCNFINNTGGAIYFFGMSTLNNTKFINNAPLEYTEILGVAAFFNLGQIENCIFSNTTKGVALSVIGGIIKNCEFTYNDAGGLFILAGSVDNCNFYKNHAYYGGGIYHFSIPLLFESGNLLVSNCNFTYNTADKGSAIYAMNITAVNSTFINNKQNAVIDYKIGQNLSIRFNSEYSLINAIAVYGQNIVLKNITYWNGTIVTEDMPSTERCVYPDFNITVEIYDESNVLLENVTLKTNNQSTYEYESYNAYYDIMHLPDGNYSVKIYRLEDNYYSYTEKIGKITLKRNASSVNITTKASEFQTYNCLIEFNITNRTIVRAVITDKNGNVLFDEFTDKNYIAPNLNKSDDPYNLTIYNFGNEYYAPSKATKLFKIIKEGVIIRIDTIENVTYGNTVNITFDGVNLTTVNLTVYDDSRNIVFTNNYTGGNTITLSDLAAGQYTVIALNYENETHISNTTSAIFNVDKAPSSVIINPIGDVIYGDPLNIIFNGVNGTVFSVDVYDSNNNTVYSANVTQSITIPEIIAVGQYSVKVINKGDKNHSESINTTIFNVVKAEVVIIIDPVNATYASPFDIDFTVIGGTIFNVTIQDIGNNIIYQNTTNSTKVRITENWAAGQYNVTVSSNSDNNHTPSTASLIFNIKKAGSSIKLKPIDDIIYLHDFMIEFIGENRTIVNITLYDADKNIIFESETYDTGIQVVGWALNAGQYNVTVINRGDENHSESTDSILFNIVKEGSSITINPIENVTYGETTKVTYTGENITTVNLTVYNASKNIVFTNNYTGITEITLPVLAAGQYNVTLTNYGDEGHSENSDFAIFNVAKASSSISIEQIEDIIYGNTLNVVFNGVNGTIFNVTVYGTDKKIIYTANVTQSTMISDIIAVGKYNVTVINYGDENHSESSDSILFNIVKAGSSITINPIENATYGETTKVTYTGENITTVNLTVYNASKNIVFTNNYTGITEITLPVLAAGQYNVTLTNYGDEDHTENSDFTIFNVAKAPSSVTIAPIPDVTYKNPIDIELTAVGGNTFNVTVYDSDKNIVYENTVTDNAFTINSDLAAGQYNITVTNNGDGNHTPYTASLIFNILKSGSSITINPIETVPFDKAATVTYTGDNITTVNITVYDDSKNIVYTDNYTGVTEITLPILVIGQYNVTLTNYGDENHTANTDSKTFKVISKENNVTVTVEDVEYGTDANVKITADVDGEYIVDINGTELKINVVEGKGNKTISLPGGQYYANATFNNNNWTSNIKNATFKVNPTNNYEININISSALQGENVTVNVTLPENALGFVNVTVNGENYTAPVKDGVATVEIPNLPAGDTQVNITYSGDNNYGNKTVSANIHIIKLSIDAADAKYGLADSYEYEARLVSENETGIPNRTLTFTINGETYNATTDNNGVAKVNLKALKAGSYNITISCDIADNVTHKITIIQRVVENVNLVMDYESDKSFTVKAIGDNGNPISDAIVNMTVNGVTYNVKTDKNGVAKLIIHLKPNTYVITCSYKNTTVNNTIKVKYTLKAKKTLTLKKTAKKLVLKATLKWSNGKAIKGKIIKFKFKGKTYKAKTNAKGIAKVTIKKKVIKKLKKGKTYTAKISYINEWVKIKVKVK